MNDDMVRPVDEWLVLHAAERIGLDAEAGDDGAVHFLIPSDGKRVSCFGAATFREPRGKLALACVSEETYDVEYLGRLQAAVAEFAAHYDCPTAYPLVVEGEAGPSVHLRGTYGVPTFYGLSLNQLTAILEVVTYSMQTMATVIHAWIQQAPGVPRVPSADELERWLRD